MVTPTLSTRDLLDPLNQVDESHEIEAKRSETELGKSALETISAFANEPGLGGLEFWALRFWSAQELSAVLGRKDAAGLSEEHLSALVGDGRFARRYPDTPVHPQQAYRARQSALPGTDGDGGRG